MQALWVPGDGTRRRLLRAKSFEVCFVLLLILFLPVNQAEETQIYAYEYLDLHVCHVFFNSFLILGANKITFHP